MSLEPLLQDYFFTNTKHGNEIVSTKNEQIK